MQIDQKGLYCSLNSSPKSSMGPKGAKLGFATVTLSYSYLKKQKCCSVFILTLLCQLDKSKVKITGKDN